MDLNYEISKLGLSDHIVRLEELSRQKTLQMILDYSIGTDNGQFRSDCKIRHKDMVGIVLGVKEQSIPSKEIEQIGVKKITEINIDEPDLNREYIVYDLLYPKFLTAVFHHHLHHPCWFLPSKQLDRYVVYNGRLSAVLLLIEYAWRDIYEFTIAAKDLSWMVDYNHHHAILIYGDKESEYAKHLIERENWTDKVMEFSLYPKTEQ